MSKEEEEGSEGRGVRNDGGDENTEHRNAHQRWLWLSRIISAWVAMHLEEGNVAL